MTKVREFMNPKVLTLTPEKTLGQAIELLAENHCSGAPVVAKGKIVGIISELELFDVLFDSSLRDASVSEYMSSQVETITEDDSLGHAVHMFALYGRQLLPVLKNDKLVGIVSRRDILLNALRSESSCAEATYGFIPFLDEPATNGLNQEQFLQESCL